MSEKIKFPYLYEHPFLKESSSSIPQERKCEHAGGCPESAHFKAPRSRYHPSYYWFCLKHVREYNQNWNYYAGMSPEEIEADQRKDYTWERPTKPFGIAINQNKLGFSFHDPLNVFDTNQDYFSILEDQDKQSVWQPNSPESKAAALFDLNPPLNMKKLKERYKELVKKYHPDRNGGCSISEDKLKNINQAYLVLKQMITQTLPHKK